MTGLKIADGAAGNPLSVSVPHSVVLDQNYPNPFNPTTTIAYGVPAAGPVRLIVYDLLGREVAVLVDATQAPGTYRVPLAMNGQVRTHRLTLQK